MAFLGIHIISSAKLKALQAAAAQFAHTEADKVVAALKQTEIGAAVAADVQAVSSKTLSGAQKFEAVLANTVPLVLKYVTGGGISAVAKDVEGIARQLVQSVYSDTLDTGFGKIVRDLLKLLGLAK